MHRRALVYVNGKQKKEKNARRELDSSENWLASFVTVHRPPKLGYFITDIAFLGNEISPRAFELQIETDPSSLPV